MDYIQSSLQAKMEQLEREVEKEQHSTLIDQA